MVVFQHDIPESRNLQGAALASIGEWALRAGVAGRVEQVFDCSHSLAPEIRRAADLPSDENGALAGLAIGWVPRPPMLLAFADRTGLEQNRSCPSFDGPGRRPTFLLHQHGNHSSAARHTNPWSARRFGLLNRAGIRNHGELQLCTYSAGRFPLKPIEGLLR
jgi:hypothetical protein